MKQEIDFKKSKLLEMNKNELQEVQGGGIWILLGVAAKAAATAYFGALAMEVVTEGSEQCWEDLKAGYQSTQ